MIWKRTVLHSLAILATAFPAVSQSGESPPREPTKEPPNDTVQLESEDEGAVDKELLETFRAAARLLEKATDLSEIVRASVTLEEGLPESRSVLHECVHRGSRQAKGVALRILGESGEASLDLDVVAKSLRDPDAKVRLAAVLAVRRLGRLGYSALSDYISSETDVNNKKMAVQTFKEWRNDEAVPTLVGMLKEEKDKGVRNFIVNALEALTKQRLGHDIQAWEEHVEKMALLDQASELLEKERGQLLRRTEVEESKP